MEEIIELAKRGIKAVFEKEDVKIEDIIKENKYLLEKGATFVTLTKNGELRGCIGSLEAKRPLYEDIIVNAQLAAFRDKRFEELKEEEDIRIEISILSKPKKLEYKNLKDLKNKLRPEIDGVILTYKDKSATYLPQVWEEIKDKDEFLISLCKKAGLKKKILKENPKIEIYNVKKIKEKEKREMTVAGSFYPETKKEIKNIFINYRTEKNIVGIMPEAIVVPHAGYIYSGETAYKAYDSLGRTKRKRVIVIGPSHNTSFEGITGTFKDEIETPLGNIEIDKEYLKSLKEKFKILDEEYYKGEHSTEVQMPFIKYFTEMKVVELIYGSISDKEMEELIKYLLEDEDNCIVISTDLSHFYNNVVAEEKDKRCIEGFEKGKSFEGCEACGIIGLKAISKVSKEKGYIREILEYKTSEKTSNDSSSVVGYMSGIIYKNRFDF